MARDLNSRRTLPITPIPIITITGEPMDAFCSRLRGRLITPDDAECDDARRLLYFNVDRAVIGIASQNLHKPAST